MWILDSSAQNEIDLWDADGKNVLMHRVAYSPPFYLHLPDPHQHREMMEAVEVQYRAHECRFTTLFGELDGYAVYGDRVIAGRIEQQSGLSAQLYNVDVRHDQQYMAEHGMFPCGYDGESRFSPSVNHPLRVLELRIPGNPAIDSTINAAEILFESKPEWFTGTEQQVLSDIFTCIEVIDPDVVFCPDADRWMPLVVRKTRMLGIPFSLSRTGTYRRMDARSYWSYGRMEHREGAVIPFGRILIDTKQSFVFREGGLAGVLIGARLSGLSPNLVSRFTPGTLISSYEVYEALRRGIAVPFRKRDPESVRRFREMKISDKGGMMFQPRPGVYEDVYEIDFTSLYPSIIVQSNLSPETIEHPEKEGFLATVLEPLLAMRLQAKQQKKQDPGCAGIDSILKWMLVTCFGYTGYRNAKFGRIEVHERITGRSREILLRTKNIAEAMGFTVLHGIVDCLWVRNSPNPVEKLKAQIEREIRLPTEVESYSWLAFLPLADSRFGAYNRYYGRLTDGSI